MAEIALNLVLNGVPVAVSSIEDLEAALARARGELGKLSIGSSEFKKLSSEIQNADTKLKSLKEQSQGLSFEKQIGSIVKVGSAITSSFVAAKAAVGLFGGEQEKVAEAAVKAQQGLTIVLALREGAEGAVAIKTAASTVATTAQTLATNASNAATKALYTTIAANPYGALLAILGGVIAAVYLLVDAETDEEKQAKESAAAQKEYSLSLKTAGITAALAAEQVGFLTTQLDDNAISFEKADAAIRALVPQLGNVNLKTKEGRDLFDRYSSSLASVAFYTDQLKTLEAQFTKARESGNAQEQIRIRGLINSITLQRSAYQAQVKEIEKINDDIGKQLQLDEENRKKIDEARQRRIDEEIAKRLELLRVFLEQQRASLLLINQGQKFIDTDSKIVQLLKDRIKNLEQVKKSLGEQVPFVGKVKNAYDIFNKTLTSTGSEVDIAKKGFDNLNKTFDEQILKIQQTGPFEDLTLVYEDLNLQAKSFAEANKNILNEDTLKNIDAAVQNTKRLINVFNDLKKSGTNFDFKSLEDAVKAYNKALTNTQVNPNEVENTLKTLNEQRDKFVSTYIGFLQQSVDYKNALTDTSEEGVKKLALLNSEYGKTALGIFELTKDNIVNFEQFKKGVQETYEEVVSFNDQLKGLAGAELRDFLLKNKDLLAENYKFDIKVVKEDYNRLLLLQDEIADQRYDIEEKYSKDIINLEKQLKAQGVDISEFTYEEKLILLEKFYGKAVKTTQDGEEKLLDEEKKKLERFKATLAEIQGFLNSLAQTSQQFFDLQFSKLENRYQRTLKTIVGDTDRANQLRLEAEEDYNTKKAKLEKQAAKVSLSISLAQATANTAEAITKVYATYAASGPVAAVFAGLAAALSAVQVGIIAAQIAQIDKYQSGGRIRRGQGGMVVGPTHEMGGVNFSNGIQLEGGESVLNRMSTLRYSDLLSQVNMAGGGKPIVMNNFDDSRIVEALAKQKQTPIRAYVVESDITSKQTITRRLEQLSQL